MYIYYGVARVLGKEDPLGSVELGEHFGYNAWNDTQRDPSESEPSSLAFGLVSLGSIMSYADALPTLAAPSPIIPTEPILASRTTSATSPTGPPTASTESAIAHLSSPDLVASVQADWARLPPAQR